MSTRKRHYTAVDLARCTLSTLPDDTFTVEKENDVLYRLLELLPEYYSAKNASEHRMSEALITRIILEARSIIYSEPILVEVESPVYICGDIHGQYYDLTNIFTRCPVLGGTVLQAHGKDSGSSGTGAKRACREGESGDGEDREERATQAGFVFLGDYVDRGSHSIEVVVTLMALKIICPEKITMLRGNHEDEQIMFLYGFYDECKRRYNVRLFKLFADLFRVLPIAAIVNKSIFCTHGGLSVDLQNAYDIADPRPCNVPHSGVLCDLLWADPEIDLPRGVDWAPSPRRISYVFSPDALDDFLDNNELDLVCRAHQVVEEGYQFFPSCQKRRLLTVFSATNYCSEFGNRGGILCVDAEGVCSILTLEPPNFIQQRHIQQMRDN